MRPPLWHPPIELSTAEQAIIKRIRRAKLFVFLRQHRHELFCDTFQQELATLYTDRPQGQPPVPPAQLALATILQAYSGVSDDEVIEATTMDRRWQMVLACLDSETPPFSKATLVAFRHRLIAQQMDRRLLERTVAIAATSGAFGARQLRAALDSSPLWGAGRVEDTYNLLGHALRKALGVIARQQGRGLTEMASEVGTALVAGSSLKAALDLDWDDPGARQQALTIILDTLTTVEHWLASQPAQAEGTSQVAASLAVAHQVQMQDITLAPDGTPTLRQGVAADRRISVEDAEMRHGRKSRSLLVDGYKRHVLRDLDSRLIVAVGVTPANVPEASVTDAIETDLAAQQSTLQELHIDRAYLASKLVQQRAADLTIFCKAWPVRQGPYFSKRAFHLDWERHTLQCPGGQCMPFVPGAVVKFPAATCARCALRERCTTSASGRSVTIHPDEALLQELRERQQTPQGRAKLRERIAVEHALAHVGRWQGRRARYRGVRKNVFDLRRCAVVHNLHVLMRLPQPAEQAA
jgi:transposase